MSIYTLGEACSGLEVDRFSLLENDPSLNLDGADALGLKYQVDGDLLEKLFLAKYDLAYIRRFFERSRKPLRVVSYPKETNTCYEKAEILSGWNPLNVVKAFYLESLENGNLYGIIVPETGCFLDRDNVREQLGLPEGVKLAKATQLPEQMSYGTCSPFIQMEDLVENGGKLKAIVFDRETLIIKRQENLLDDFSFGMEHRFSIQMNYFQCYKMLSELFSSSILERDVLKLSFKERLVRKKGRIKIDYEFRTLNYRSARFINEIHGYGDVSIVNDHVDELMVPEVLTLQ